MEDVSDAILSCIESGLSEYGNSVPGMVFWNFEHRTKLSRKEICLRPDLFSQTLRHTFVESSLLIERKVVAEVALKFNLPERDYHGFVDVMEELNLRIGTLRKSLS